MSHYEQLRDVAGRYARTHSAPEYPLAPAAPSAEDVLASRPWLYSTTAAALQPDDTVPGAMVCSGQSYSKVADAPNAERAAAAIRVSGKAREHGLLLLVDGELWARSSQAEDCRALVEAQL